MNYTAFIFPGQGSQTVGMGKELYDTFEEARLTFQEVDDALNQKLSKVIFEGPVEELTLTANTQPALMAVSVATTRVLLKQSNQRLSDLCHYVAGHSLGEYSALCASGTFSLADTATLLKIRGNAMQDAVPQDEGGMTALIGVDLAKAQEFCQVLSAYGDIQVANDNGGGQVVISGQMAVIDKSVEIASENGIKRAVKLPVSAPFHSSLMAPAAEKMQEALADISASAPCVPLIANVTAQAVTDVDTIKHQLVEQVTGMVRWRESIETLQSNNVEDFTEIGAGKVLAGLVKRINKSANTQSLQTPQDIEDFLS